MSAFAQRTNALIADAEAFAQPRMARIQECLIEAQKLVEELRGSGIAVRELSRMSSEGLDATRFELSFHRKLKS